MAAVPDPGGGDRQPAGRPAVRRRVGPGGAPARFRAAQRGRDRAAAAALHTVRLAQALLGRAVLAPARPRRSGAALVEAHLTEPRALDWSVQALGDRFAAPGPAGPVADRPTTAERVAALQGALAAGFARALRDRTFAQQERIARSAWQARDEVEQALRDSEARFRAVFAGAAIGIGIAGVDGRIIDVNQAFADMLGYSHRGVARDQRGRAVPPRRRRRDVGALPGADRGQARQRPGWRSATTARTAAWSGRT